MQTSRYTGELECALRRERFAFGRYGSCRDGWRRERMPRSLMGAVVKLE